MIQQDSEITTTSKPARYRLRFSFGSALVTGLGTIGLLFLTLPILALIIRSIQNRAWENMPGSAIPEAILLSFVSTSMTILATAMFGTPLAYILARRKFPFKRLAMVLVELPIVLPPAVAGLALLITFGRRGLFGPVLGELGISLSFTFAAVVMAQTFVAAPFYIRSAQIGFQSIPIEIEEAARVDGAGGFRLFWLVTLPIARRALAAGLVLCWARALGEFGATILFAGSLQGRTQTMPLLIYNIFERDIDAAIWTGLILVAIALVALLISHWLARNAKEQDTLVGTI
ncbi:MAG: molybdate ABC transporter, inner membrane subunit [Chloroflexi bacterium OLB15]|nr:MAG: molybdate ABC transporter, inner membrane subunit [Chloroflexi bacterium OLB15]